MTETETLQRNGTLTVTTPNAQQDIYECVNPLWPGDTKYVSLALPLNFSHALRIVQANFRRICLQRHRKYGPSNIASHPDPEYGIATRCHDKLSRIFHAIRHGGKEAPGEADTLDDAWLDLGNYAAIAALVRKGWWHLPDNRRMLVYVAGPYTGGDIETRTANILRASEVAVALLRKGHFPICPHTMTAPWDGHVPIDMILTLDAVLLSLCDAILRLEGASPGADMEVEIATDLGIPTYYSPEEVPT